MRKQVSSTLFLQDFLESDSFLSFVRMSVRMSSDSLVSFARMSSGVCEIQDCERKDCENTQ